MLTVGSKAPDFSLKASDGKIYSLKKLKGKTVVLYFYPKDDTPGCTLESCGFRDREFEFSQSNAIIFGISRDDHKSHVRFSQKYRLNFPLLSDESGKVCKAYGVWREKSFLGIKSMGIVRSTFIIGEGGKIEAIFDNVNPLGHANSMLFALKLLRAKKENFRELHLTSQNAKSDSNSKASFKGNQKSKKKDLKKPKRK
ncbi:thioredoxin-dependent thiol peroxidase [Candidatus Micrarchaeota archaeon]|nr:thioredoxin-dependent thiol peroxidase [Candidatus Micrarchaeota archaeon]